MIRYTEDNKKRVIELHLTGITDSKISKITGFGYGFIQTVTTKYWKNKMLCEKQLQDKSADLT